MRLLILLLLIPAISFSQMRVPNASVFGPKEGFKVNSANIFLPGFGTSHTLDKEHPKLSAIGFYGAMGAGGYFLFQTVDGISEYNVASDYDEANAAYNNVANSKNLMYASLGAAGAIWLFEMIRGNIAVAKKKKAIKEYRHEYMSLNIHPALINQRDLNAPKLGVSLSTAF